MVEQPTRESHVEGKATLISTTMAFTIAKSFRPSKMPTLEDLGGIARSLGASISGDLMNGRFEVHGVLGRYRFEDNELELTVDHKPAHLADKDLQRRLRAWLSLLE